MNLSCQFALLLSDYNMIMLVNILVWLTILYYIIQFWANIIGFAGGVWQFTCVTSARAISAKVSSSTRRAW